MKIDDPGTLAGDLITGTVGALSMYKPPIIIVDMGTATTIVAVDKDGAYIGGAIVPGVNLSFEALSQGTSLLPNISIEAPRKCIATNTVDSMKSGAVFGTASTRSSTSRIFCSRALRYCIRKTQSRKNRTNNKKTEQIIKKQNK